MSFTTFGKTKTRRFFSRKIAEINEGKVTSALVRDLDEELRQTLGPSILRRHEISEDIKAQAKEAELLRENIKAMYKATATATAALAAYCESLRGSQKSFVTFMDMLAEGQQSDVLKTVLADVSNVHATVASGMDTLLKSMDVNLVNQFQTYVKTDVRDARYFSHDFIKVQLEYEAAINKLNQLKQKQKVDARKYHAANQELNQFQDKFDMVAEEAQHRFSRMQETNAVDNAQSIVAYLQTMREFFAKGHQMFDELGPKLDDLQKDADLKRTKEKFGKVEALQRSSFSFVIKPIDNRYYELIETLARPPLIVISAFSEVAPPEEASIVFQYVIRAFQHQGFITPLFQKLIRTTLNAQDDEPDWSARPLLAQNHVGLRLLSEYLRLYGKYYASMVLGPTIKAILKEPKALEMDPRRASLEETEVSASKISNLLADLYAVIFDSKVICPKPIRVMCEEIRIVVESLGKTNANQHICGFIFLRFLVSALGSPDAFNIVPEDALTPVSRRSLTVVAAVFRNMVKKQKSDVVPGEEYLRVFDQSNEKYHSALENFLDLISQSESLEEGAGVDGLNNNNNHHKAASPSDLFREQVLEPLVAKFDRSMAKLVQWLTQNGHNTIANEWSDLIKYLMEQQQRPPTTTTPPPPPPPQLSPLSSPPSSQLTAFITPSAASPVTSTTSSSSSILLPLMHRGRQGDERSRTLPRSPTANEGFVVKEARPPVERSLSF